MREALVSMSDIPQDGTVTVDLYGREVLVMLLNGKPRAYQRLLASRWSAVPGGRHVRVRVARLDVRGANGPRDLGSGSAGREADDAPHSRRGRRPDPCLRRVTRRSGAVQPMRGRRSSVEVTRPE